jgi:hypothetical protein
LGFESPIIKVQVKAKDGTISDHGQYVYILQCAICGLIYGANGPDIFERKCPKRQNDQP